MRLRNVKNAFEIIENSPLILSEPEKYKGNYHNAFINAKKVELEIGTGKGDFLKQMALQNKDSLYIGIEMMSSVICRACQKIDPLELSNIKLINKDGKNILDYFSEGEIDNLYLNFPDPWPKAKHEKRRLTSPAFLDMYKKVLKKDGVFRLKTDNYDLFLYSKETILNRINVIECGEADEEKELIKTEFESKYVALGKKIYVIKGTFK